MNHDTLYLTMAKYRNCGNTALYFRSSKINYEEFAGRVDETADRLFTLGVRKDTVVSLLAPNVPDSIICLYALSKIGARVSILHPLLPKNTLKKAIVDTRSEYLLVMDALYHNYEDVIPSLNQKVYFVTAYVDLKPLVKPGFKILYHKDLKPVDGSRYLYRQKLSHQVFPVNDDADRPAIYLRSGGTTGHDKIVCINEHAISFVAAQSSDILGEGCYGKSMIGVLPIFHGFGLAMGIHAPLMNGAASYLMIDFKPKEIVKAIKKGKLNYLLTIPYLTEKLMATKGFSGKKLQNLIAAYIGADKPQLSLFDRFNSLMEENGSRCRLLQGYGLTETVTVNFVNTSNADRIGSVGRPIKGVKLRICGDDLDVDLGPNKEGNILISSDSVCLGYLNTPKEKQPFHYDEDGTKWLITGDIGYYDEDGFLFFINRETDVVKIAGYNVFPSDIEKCAEAVEGIRRAACVYVEDDRHPYCHLYLTAEQGANNSELLNKVSSSLKDNLIRYSVPEKIEIIDDFPYTEIGKIDRKKLKEKALASKGR